jgi:Fic family protein
MEWFIACLARAIGGAQTTLSAVLQKSRFWQKLRDVQINERQRVVLNRLVDGCEGDLTTSKWAKIAKCSSDTAPRDISELVAAGILVRNAAGGRSTSYTLDEG